ncbi:MAG: CHRD domain-containing protein [Acidimicrobiia bacterium]
MQPRLVVTAAVLAAAMSMGTSALAHGGGGEPSPPPADRQGNAGPDRPHHRGAFSFPLSGSQVPGGGDPQGRGQATLRLDPERETVCLGSNWEGLAGDVTALHIHRAPEGQTGPHHIEILNDESLSGTWNHVEFCVHVASAQHAHHEGHDAHGSGGDAADVIQDVVDDPGAFYLNVHTSAFPKGAIRGQLDG